ncbi:hypothetical protein MPL1032_370026 [Mesorhizobium plurifarium]|uniref:Uncharacterized protein n=1 Tax=Mesorhizobium plurifarium TaxID=69974 RepID=A0A0K2W571_MESPL|nr:hypothetical protein MPL1032_370026 [Mesorhizobium plurifarium]
MTFLFLLGSARLEFKCGGFYFSAQMTEKEDQSDVPHNGILPADPSAAADIGSRACQGGGG